MKIFSGNANPSLAKDIASILDMSLSGVKITTFKDKEIAVQIEESVRGYDVFIIQSTCPPVNDHLMELLILTDALKRASVNSITAVLPYFGYARQDRKAAPRVPISAKLVANLIQKAGVNRVVTMDLHAGQIQGFFDIPVDNLYGSLIFSNYLKQQNITNLTIASPDMGGVARARSLAKVLDVPLVIVDKRRERANESDVMNIIGDVQDQYVVLVDDMIDTGGTLVKAAKALKDAGASGVMACCTHALLSGDALDKLETSELDKLAVTNTIPRKRDCSKIVELSVANLFAETIRRIINNESVNVLFE